jgi:hypothetical protein
MTIMSEAAQRKLQSRASVAEATARDQAIELDRRAHIIDARDAEIRGLREALAAIGDAEAFIARVGTVEKLQEKLEERDREIERLQGEVSDLSLRERAQGEHLVETLRQLEETEAALENVRQAHEATENDLAEAIEQLNIRIAALVILREEHTASEDKHAAELKERDPKDLAGRLQREREAHKVTARLLREAQLRLAAHEGVTEPSYQLGQTIQVAQMRQGEATAR